jgi:putative glycerol-1-phosphate prenyltransferase
MQQLYNNILDDSIKKVKKLAVLIDPDQINQDDLRLTIEKSVSESIDYFFVGGSLLFQDCLDEALELINELSDIPTIIFPGNDLQISDKADAILYLSLISGRNPEFLIGKQVISAPLLSQANIEVIGTGYILVNGGQPTAASYMSSTQPIPYDQINIAVSTALAGQFLGHKIIFMDGGSGAEKPISSTMISAVKKHLNIPLIIGGGIISVEQVKSAYDAGADIVVIGNAIEKDVNFISEIAAQRYL